MVWFIHSKKAEQRESDEELEKILKFLGIKVAQIEASLVKYDAEIERLANLIKSLRGFVNKKLHLDEEEDGKTEKDIYDDGLNMFRL